MMKDPEIVIRGTNSSRVSSPELSEPPVLGGAVLKAQKVRVSKKLSWVGYEDLIKNRPAEDYGRSLNVSPNGASRRSSRLASPDNSRAPSRGPSPIGQLHTELRRVSPVEIRAKFSQEPPDLYSFPKSKSHVRFSASLPKLPVDSSGVRRGTPGSPELERDSLGNPELHIGPLSPSSPQLQRPSGLLLSEEDRHSIFGAPHQAAGPEIQITYTPRVPGDHVWREGQDADPPSVPERLEKQGLLLSVPDYLESLRGFSREGDRGSPFPGSRPSNIAGVPVAASHRRSTFVRAVEAVTTLGATVLAPSTERRTSKYVTTAAKKNSTVIVPVNAKQWLLQSLRMQDWELRELFDQMEMIPQLAADHVREVRAEWESLEARSLKVPPEADMLLKDQQLLEITKALLRRFIKVVSEDGGGGGSVEEELQHRFPPRGTTPDIGEGIATTEQACDAHMQQESSTDKDEAYREQIRKERDSFVTNASSSPIRGSFSPVQLPPKERSGSVLGRPVCPACGRLDTSAPNTIIRGGVLPRESMYQERAPSIPHQILPSFIPFEDYVIKQSVVKPTGKFDQFKTTYSPLDKRWYTVLFPALQPGKREDVTLLSEWLLHATQKNCVEDSDGHFSNVETAFVLHCVAFLEIVRQTSVFSGFCQTKNVSFVYRSEDNPNSEVDTSALRQWSLMACEGAKLGQVRIHCEERGDMILHVWRQLLRIFNQTMSRAEPKVKALEEEINRHKEINKKDASEIKRLTTNVEKTNKSLQETEEKLKIKTVEISKMRRCRLCVAGNMTPRTRETFIKKSMMKRYSQLSGSGLAGSLVGGLGLAGIFGPDGKEKTHAELLADALAEGERETVRRVSDEFAKVTDGERAMKGSDGPVGDASAGAGFGAGVANEGEPGVDKGAGEGGVDDGSGGAAVDAAGVPTPGEGGSQVKGVGRYKSTTVITFLRAALLKRSQRPTLDEAAKKQIAEDMATVGLSLIPATVEKLDKETQTDSVAIEEVGEFASVLKRSASCPARLFWIEEKATAEQQAKHRSWMEEHGLVGPEGEKSEGDESLEKKPAEGDDDEVEIIFADKVIKHPEGEEAIAAAEEAGVKEKKPLGQIQKTMKKRVNRLASESLETLASIEDDVTRMAGGADVALKMALLISKWKKVMKATVRTDEVSSEGGESGGTEGGENEDFEWEDYELDEGEEGDGRGRRKKRSRGMRKGSSGTLMDELSAGVGRTRRSIDGVSLGGKSSLKKSGKSSGQGFELGKLVPLGFASMMNINVPPKSVKFFNERQLTKLITSVYVAKIDADTVDDAADNERQSSCEFVYDFMLNLYGLKRLAESAVWGVFKKIKHLIHQKKIDKAHKARMFYRFCGMDDGKFYSERDLYLYLRVLARGMARPGLFYPSEQDDGINYVNCVWAESFAEEPMLQEYLGSQAAAAEFINNFVAAHAVPDKVSLEVKKITKTQNVKRIDFDEFMEAVLEKGSIQSQVVSIPKKIKKGDKPKAPLTPEKRQALENLFTAGDANQDGVLTFSEFREILSSADESISQQTALRIFRETLLLEPEGGDKISPLAFATVAHEHNIAAPPSVIYNLLKKTWLQIQGDINENKVKDEAAKKESDELRMKLATYIDEAKENTVNQAVLTFKEYVLKFCGPAEGEEAPPEDEIEEEEEEEEDEKPQVHYVQSIQEEEASEEET